MMSGVSIEYKGNTIATIEDTGSKTLKTQGKYCEGDILVEYEAPPTPTPTLITKQITENGTYSAEDDNADGYSEVTVDVPVPAPIKEKDVNFYDYDGTVLYAYTAQEALALAELPEAPTHEGLTFQGWNRTLAQLQNYVTDYGIGDAGATYITDDGATRLYLEVDDDVSLDYELYVQIANGTLSVEVDSVELGSATGTTSSYVNYTIPFTLSTRGNVRVDLKFTGTGGFRIGQGAVRTRVFGWNSDQNDSLVKVELGEPITGIDANAFQSCASLNGVVIPSSVTRIGNYAFYGCTSLNGVVIPSSVTNIGTNAFLNGVVIPSSVTSIGASAFNGCASLNGVVIPSSVTSIGTSAFQSCTSLNGVVIPSSVTSIGASVFRDCALLLLFDLSQYTDSNNLPTFSNSNFLSGTPTDQIIYVANQEMLTTFSSATNMSTYAGRLRIKEASS